MRMAKASEADLKMALDLSSMLESFERGYFPTTPENEEETPEPFDRDNHICCVEAMELILDKLREGSLFRVTFGMQVVLDPKNEVVDPDLPHLDKHPKTRRALEMHGEMVAALRSATSRLRITAEQIRLGRISDAEVIADVAANRASTILAKLPEGG